jgi:putative DNA primase/helicase
MSDFLSDFIDAMSASGCAPAKTSDIHPGAKNKLIRAETDSNGSKSLYYTFDVEGDKASGRWYSCKLGVGDCWFSKSNKSWSKEERDAWAKARKAEQESAEREIQETYEKVAAQAEEVWKSAQPNPDHPYLKAKDIPVCGTKCIDDMLLVPMRDSKQKLWNLQTILPDGSKYNSFKVKGKWVKGGRKQGCYHSILKKGVPLDTIYIGEGLATCGSVFKATSRPVLVAFDAGNLKPVTKAIHDKYRRSKIVICADNDQWVFKTPRHKDVLGLKASEIKGNDNRWLQWAADEVLCNPGKEKARQAAVSVGGFVIYPEFDPLHKDKPTDFNDLQRLEGIKAVADRLEQVNTQDQVEQDNMPPEFDVVPIDVYERVANEGNVQPVKFEFKRFHSKIRDEYSETDEYGIPKWYQLLVWKEEPTARKEGKIEKNSGLNTRIFLERAYGGLFRYNEFSDDIWVCRCPPWEDEQNFLVRPIKDTDVTNMAQQLERNGLSYNPARTKEAILVCAEQDPIHPCREYFDQLEWDGTPRLHSWLKTYCGAFEQDERYLSAIGTMWMVAAVRRIYEPGTKFDHMLILEGKQAAGKSTLLEMLATFGRDVEHSYFTDQLKLNELDKPSSLTILQGKLIIEFAELDGMDRTSDNALKSWITKRVDEVVKKYKNFSTKYPRQCVLAGSTNDSNYLRDDSGNRRYWPVKCSDINTKDLSVVKEQMWAEAVHLHKEGYKIHLPRNSELYNLAGLEQHKRLSNDTWEDDVLAYAKDHRYVTTVQVLKGMNFNLQQTNASDQNRIKGILLKNGWQYGQFQRLLGHRKRVFLNPAFSKDEIANSVRGEETELDF